MSNDVIKFYHNPRCSKSRQALQLISSQNITLEIIKLIIENPIIIQRPLAIKYEKDIFIDAVIGRPPEMVLNLLN